MVHNSKHDSIPGKCSRGPTFNNTETNLETCLPHPKSPEIFKQLQLKVFKGSYSEIIQLFKQRILDPAMI